MDELTFQPILSPIMLVIVFVIALLMLLVGPSFAKLPPSRRITLTVLRLGVIGLALVTALRPGCIQKIEKSQSAVLLFLVDATRSMELPHISDDSTRWGVTRDMIKQNESRFRRLAENKIDVRFFSFDNQTKPLEFNDGVVGLPAEPDGGETDIGTAIYDTSLDVRDQRLLAVFLASDGVQNVLEPDVEMSQAVDSLSDMEVPLMAVQLGMPGVTSQVADVAITSFAEQMVVNKNNELVARATMLARAYANQDIAVELLVTDSQGVEKQVATDIYRASSNYEEINVELKYTPTDPGEYRIKVRAVPMPSEKAIRNNDLEGFLTVRDKGMRVLFVNGPLGWEQKFLRDSLPAMAFIEMKFSPIYSYKNERDRWPVTRFEGEFRDLEKYDVVILCNVDSRALYDENTHTGTLEALRDAVRAGKGLLMIGGSHSFGPGLYHSTPLADVLPVIMRPSERQDFDSEFRRDFHINTPFKVTPAKDHFLTRIGDAGSNKAIWAELPPLASANRISVKDTAEVLLHTDDEVQRPIMAAANVGGRVIAFAADSTWSWKRNGFGAEHDQFWRQMILWLAFWDSRNDESVSIELPKRRYSPKALIKFDVNVKTISGEVVEGVEFDAALILPSGERKVITITRTGDRYQSQLDPEWVAEPGLYKIQVAASRNGASIGQTQREFVVMDRDKEKANPVANPEQMAKLASQTSEFGGRALLPEELSEVLDSYIENPPTTKIEIPTKWRLGETFPDALGFLLAFVGLLAAEWLLRKKWGLV